MRTAISPPKRTSSVARRRDALERLLQMQLRAPRQGVVTRFDGVVRSPQRAEEPLERPRRHRRGSGEIDVRSVESERAVGEERQQRLHLGGERVVAVRGKRHHFVLVLVDAKAQVRRHDRVEEAERVGEMDLALGHQPVLARRPEAGRRPLADAVGDENARRSERRRVERECRVREVVLREQHFAPNPRASLDPLP
jgi:hypothetical protein